MTILTRIHSWLGRRYFAKLQRKGLRLEQLRSLPEPALTALRRDGIPPVPELDGMRRAHPVTRLPLPFGMNVWLVTGYDEARGILADGAFSNDFDNLSRAGLTRQRHPGGLGFTDPPAHTRLRRMLAPEFTVRRLAALAPRIEAIVTGRLDRMAAAGAEADLVRDFALPIPSLMICELLDVPYHDRADFQRLSVARFDLFAGASAALDAVSESLTYFRELVRAQRKSPTGGLIGRLVRRHGDQIDDEELAGLADGLLTGGFETTASMLAVGTLALLQNRKLAARMCGTETEADQTVDLAVAHQAPSAAHPVEAGELGRGVLLRCIYGLRVSLTAGVVAALVSTIRDTVIGALAGRSWFGWTGCRCGRVERSRRCHICYWAT